MPSAAITLERSLFIGLIFTSILYGIIVILYFLSFRLLYQRSQLKTRKFYIIYSSFLLLFSTISTGISCAFGDLVWVDDQNIPGGPLAYYASNISAWYNTLGFAVDMTTYAMADGLLLYRCFMFWSDRPWVVILPALIYVSSVAMSIVTTVKGAMPGANIFQGLPANFGIPWMALTISFNIIVTLLIIGRLLTTYWTVRETLSPAVLLTYVNVSAMLVESALPYSALGIANLIFVVMNSSVAVAVTLVWGPFSVLAPQFIIYRVALGVAWTKDTTFAMTHDIRFASDSQADREVEFTADKNTGPLSRMGGLTPGGPSGSSTDVRLYLHDEEVQV